METETQSTSANPQTPKQSNLPKIIFILAIIVIGGAGFFLMKKNKHSIQQTPVVSQPTEAMKKEKTTSAPSEAMKQEEKEFTVTGSNFAFDPKEIKVKKGDKVKVIFKNANGLHDFVLDEFNVRTNRINGGEQAEVTFTADKTGTFEYYCSVGKHREMGMKGTLIVE